MSTIEKALQKNKALQENKAKDNSIEKAVEKQAETADAVEAAPAAKPKPAEKASPATSHDKPTLSLEHVREGFVSNVGRQIINEEYRAIKRKVLNNAFGPLAKTLNNSNIIMVTSPNPNEGKTFTSINLALSIALEQDKTVLLVDADVLRPSVMKTLQQPFENGLMEYLLGEVKDVGDVIYHTDLETLKVIPAGKSHHLSTELLASEKMLESVNEFSNRYPDRVVIIDSPPLVGINETAILANLAGQAVVVVQEGKTSLTRLSQAVDQLNPDMAKGFVINKSTRGSGDGSDYYGYYYGSKAD
ncbi:XrtA-associated tyrosine autokinase [Aestuariibacter halophilus]|uniref:non-specific protein-tyrosine kinase n=1 Tax=Fluctibacter halophilus TaxID=226011 RepID=A0ABS8G4R7_9ALTE|nr:XrtA-associated tyrosine autokinase [Aestuariibacter halophilus]MCC2614850.1 XrtA-associated tyrosine autokinase [Aestuariibacter halophilus]